MNHGVIYYAVSTALLLISGFGVACAVYGLWRVPREWRAITPERRPKALLGTLLLVLLYGVVVWGILNIAWTSAARGQEPAPFNPILHHGRTIEIWLDPTTGPVLTVTQDALGKVHLFVDGELHVRQAATLDDDLTVQGNVSFDPRKSDVHFTPRTTTP